MDKEITISNNKAIINFSKAYFDNISDLLRSDGFRTVIKSYINFHHLNDTRLYYYLEDITQRGNFDDIASDLIDILGLLTIMSIDEIIIKFDQYKNLSDNKDKLIRIVEDLYDYWRKLERYSLIEENLSERGFTERNFISSNDKFKDLILEAYRKAEVSVTKYNPKVYRQTPAGVNAGIMVRKHHINYPECYKFLNKIQFISKVMIETPYITYTKSNKRDGFFKETDENPILNLNINPEEYFCFPAKVGDNLIYIYFHQNYITHGISASNLFELLTPAEITGNMPDAIYIFGGGDEDLDVFYEDKENNLLIGYVNYDDNKDYFGYLKKMTLTLSNIISMKKGFLPIHGACVNIVLKNGKSANIAILGDSGAGKSESIEAFRNLAKDYIRDMTVIFDDMGTFRIINDEVLAYGTEIGAFVRLDDLDSGYAFKQIDRSIFMNPDKVNARLIMPVADYNDIMKGYKVDFFLYANNYENIPEKESIEIFNDINKIKEIFKDGKRMAKGTTTEEGLVKSYFANPFGPYQKQFICNELIDLYFDKLYENKVKVGVINTKLSVENMERQGPKDAAIELFEMIKNL